MKTLAERLDRLAERGPHADAGLVIARATATATNTHLADQPNDPRSNRSPLLAVAVIAVVLIGGALIVMRGAGPDGPDGDATDAANQPGAASDQALEPVETLPDDEELAEVPVTVVGSGPSEWYRLQPDLDVSWFTPNGGPSMLCFRTPTVSATCHADTFAPTAAGGGPIGVTTAGDQLIVVTLDPGDSVTLPLDDGSTATAPLTRDPGIGWGVARFGVDQGAARAALATVYGTAGIESGTTVDASVTDTASPDQSATNDVITPTTIVPGEFPGDVPRPVTFDSMTIMTYDNLSVGWEFYDPDDSYGVQRCSEYAATFDDTWTSTPDTDESAAVIFARHMTNAHWQVGIYCTDVDEFLVQVMPTATSSATVTAGSTPGFDRADWQPGG